MRLAAETKGISETFGTKDCPRCGRQTMKGGGCNHMTCQVCRCDWCWTCSQQLNQRGPHGEGPVFWHFSEENVESGCQQFAETGGDEVRTRRRDRTPGITIKRVSMPVGVLSVMLLTIAAILALVFWMILYVLCLSLTGMAKCVARGCYRISRLEPPDALGEAGAQRLVKCTLYFAITLGMVTFLIPFFALWLIWDFVALLLWLLLATFGRLPLLRRCLPQPSCHHLRFLFSAPWRAVHRFGNTLLAHLMDNRAQAAQREFLVEGMGPEAIAENDIFDNDALAAEP